MDVREERPGDVATVRDVQRRAFGESGAKVAALTDALRDRFLPGHSLSLVAELGGEVVGHVLFTQSLLDAPRRLVDVYVLSPLAVVPAHQRQGIGGALIRAGLAILGERAVPLVFLEGNPAYYARFGFIAGAGDGFRKPSLRIPDPAFQSIRLPAYEPWMTGTLVYSEVFWQHDCVGLRDRDA